MANEHSSQRYFNQATPPRPDFGSADLAHLTSESGDTLDNLKQGAKEVIAEVSEKIGETARDIKEGAEETIADIKSALSDTPDSCEKHQGKTRRDSNGSVRFSRLV